jgi:NADPH-ferrihemoprotein reductase
VLIVFGSQTGTAEEFADKVARALRRLGPSLRVSTADADDVLPTAADASPSLWRYLQAGAADTGPATIISVIATYGEGEAPDDALALLEAAGIRDYPDAVETVEGMAVLGENELAEPEVALAVFGCGNRTYEQFNGAAYQLVAALADQGASLVSSLGLGDDDANIESDFMAWLTPTLRAIALRHSLAVSEAAIAAAASSDDDGRAGHSGPVVRLVEHADDDPAVRHDDMRRDTVASLSYPLGAVPVGGADNPDARRPLTVPILVNRELHAAGSDRSCSHVELSTNDGALRYEAGDHLGLYPLNAPSEVEALATRLGVTHLLDKTISLSPQPRVPLGPTSLRNALLRFVDIAAPPRQSFIQQVLVPATTDPAEQAALVALADPLRGDEYRQHVRTDYRSLLDLLRAHPTCTPTLASVLAHAPRLAPRYYSIASSPTEDAGRVALCCVLTEWTTDDGRHKRGVASSWLRRLRAAQSAIPLAGEGRGEVVGQTVEVFIRRSQFRLPKTLSTPMLWVGPGTGIAPFRSFWRDLQARVAASDTATLDVTLYTGCRHQGIDELYQEELAAAKASGHLSGWHAAYSRDGPAKVYVQQLLDDDEIARVLAPNGTGILYVCGDAAGMAHDVHAKVVAVLASAHFGGNAQRAERFLSDTATKAGRYAKDVWFSK